MSREQEKRRRGARPPRIRVPNQERALFTADSQKFVGVIQRLSLTGGSAVLSKGPIAKGTLAEMAFRTVFGKVKAHIEFLHSGADGIPLAQAFRFLSMDETSSRRFSAADVAQTITARNQVLKLPFHEDPCAHVLGLFLTPD